MANGRWMIYGAYGFTGRLVAEEAVRRGHRPLLAGRSRQKLISLAEDLGLESAAVSLDDVEALTRLARTVDVVYHAAGPFSITAEPMRRACLAAGCNYLDITGEISVFEETFAQNNEALRRGVALISGIGFDVVPTDCLACYVSTRMSRIAHLYIAIDALTRPSAGTAKSALGMMVEGGRVRRDGTLVSWPIGKGVQRQSFPRGERTMLPVPLADLVTAYHSTGAPNIMTYMALPAALAATTRLATPLLTTLLRLGPARKTVEMLISRAFSGPDQKTRQTARSYAWARAATADGQLAEAWLETVEPYAFTAMAAVHAVEQVLVRRPKGALTPAQAFGPDFVLAIDGTRRFDSL